MGPFVTKGESMEIRRAKKNELKTVDEVFCISFGFKRENDVEQPTSGEDVRYVAIEDGKIISAVYVPSYTMNFDGNLVKMAGIGGVSTLPQYRRKGAIRNIFSNLLPDIYNEGYVFSYLYPFSTAYYKKFGYEKACDLVKYSIKTMALPESEDADKCFLLTEDTYEKGIKIIKKAYDFNVSCYNGMTVPTKETFSWAKKENPLDDTVYTYVYEGKESYGFLSYELKREGGLHVNISRLMYKGDEALKALLFVVRSFGSDYTTTILTMPKGDSIERLISEWSFGNIKREIIPHGMVRVVNVKEALSLAKYKGSGDFKICVIDQQIKENSNKYYVNYVDGKAVTVKEINDKVDITMEIDEFSARLFGSNDIFSGLEEHKYGKIKFEDIFYQKRINITEEF